MSKAFRKRDQTVSLFLPGFEQDDGAPESKPSFSDVISLARRPVPSPLGNVGENLAPRSESHLRTVEDAEVETVEAAHPFTPPQSLPLVKPEHLVPETSAPDFARIVNDFRIDPESLPPLPSSAVERFEWNMEALQLLNRLGDNIEVSASDRVILARYSGWGGLSQLFGAITQAWAKRLDRLKLTLDPNQFESARSSVLNAHYTDPSLIHWIYRVLRHMGFKGGRIIDPSTGIGNFLGAMPADIAAASKVSAVELDPTSARIAALLYPSVRVISAGIEAASVPDGFFDLAVSNVPFGEYSVFDPALKVKAVPIHDYFFLKASTLVRPGGLIAFITSTGTLDKSGKHARTMLKASCDLVCAVRLPGSVFKDLAGTDVTTDLVVLRKRVPGEAAGPTKWMLAEEAKGLAGSLMNEYFITHRHMIVGDPTVQQRGDRKVVSVTLETPLPVALEELLQHIPTGVFSHHADAPPIHHFVRLAKGTKADAYCLHDGVLMRARCDGTSAVPVEGIGRKTSERIVGMVRVRDAMHEVLRTQVEDCDAEAIDIAIAALNVTYDGFVKKFGCLHDRANRRAFKGDPDMPSLLALEEYDDDTSIAIKMPIFHRRTIRPAARNQVATTSEEALLFSLNWNGRVDGKFMASVFPDKSEPEILADLDEKGLIWRDPETDGYETRELYLSGDVRAKLRLAHFAAEREPHYQRHVKALEAVLPEDLKPEEIGANLGAAWIPDDVVEQFIVELLDTKSIAVVHSRRAASWKVRFKRSATTMDMHSVLNTKRWGTATLSAVELLNAGLNQVTPTVYIETSDGKRRVDAQESMLAREKLLEIREHFRTWLWADGKRAVRLADLYNDAFNSTVLPSFDGAHLTFPYMSDAIVPRDYQKNFIWRYLCGGSLLAAHCVGAGKTAEAIIAHMEARRMGLISKPMFVVPNHMLEDYASEFLRIYPAANILCASKDDLAGANRRVLLARIATGDWDGVIITQASFEKLPLSTQHIEGFIDDELSQLDCAIEEAWESHDRAMAKRLEGVRNSVTAKLERLCSGSDKDTNIFFDQLGVDALCVDESQWGKNLFYVTKMSGIAGLSNSVSRRALDLYSKVLYIQSKHGGSRGVMFTTATPITNSMAEMYTVQRYLSRNLLRKHDIDSFDVWAATFGRVVSSMEVSPDGGGFRMNNRFAQFVNLPELMQLFGAIADVKTREEIKLPVPDVDGGKPTIIAVAPSEAQRSVVAELVKRAERIRAGGVAPHVDNMLSVTGDGRRAALDLRLFDSFAADDPGSKVNTAVRNVFEIWKRTSVERSTQLVFCDLSTPKPDRFNIYHDMRDKWISLGIPTEEIAFIHDYDTDEKKAALFRRVRRGLVRILLGSTSKMGIGTNVQRLLVALHHLDVPWRPDEVEQRDGRAIRPGNLNEVVQIFRYVTESTFDAYMWQCVENKARFIAQVMTPGCKVRSAEDVAVAALTYAEVKAIATGNPLFLRKAEVAAGIAKLLLKQRDFERRVWTSKRELEHFPKQLADAKERVRLIEADLAKATAALDGQFAITLNGMVYKDHAEASAALEAIYRNACKLRIRERRSEFIGKIGELWMKIQLSPVNNPVFRVAGNMEYGVNPAERWSVATVNTLRRVSKELQDAQALVDSLIRREIDLQSDVKGDFTGKDELRLLLSQQESIYKELGLLSDQAHGAVESAPTDELQEEVELV